MTAVHTLTLSELRKGLDNKQFSSLEITQALLGRAKEQEYLNSFITLAEESALEEARQADLLIAEGKSQAFTGIPVGIKDLISTKGIKTTAASNILANYVPPYDATVTSKLKEQGAVILGKLNCDEFGMGSSNENSAFGKVLNPWDKERVPGGSSGGCAAAVSAGILPMALGTDTGGSIRQPAALCNLFGLKPTYGRVSRYGLFAYASSLDTIGPFARDVKDIALSLQTIAGKDANDSTSAKQETPDYLQNIESGIKGKRIGIPKEYFIGGMQAEVEASIQEVIKEFEKLGAEIVPISLPHTKLAVSVYYIIAPAEASSNLARYDGVRYGLRSNVTPQEVEEQSRLLEMYCKTRSEGFGSEVQRRILIGAHVLSTGYYDAYYLKAQKARALIAKDFQQAFSEKCDLVLSPTSPTTAFKFDSKVNNPLEMYLNDVFTIPVNLAGLPALSSPCGFDNQGLPIGYQLIAKPWDEELLIRAAYSYQSVTDWHSRIAGS